MNRNRHELQNTRLSFAYGLCLYKLFWVFFISCIVGVIIETIWCVFMWHKLESRTGLIYGLFSPVYGFGAVMMTICLNHLTGKKSVWIFVSGIVLGGAFEYVCSIVQETLFGTVSWDYSNTPLNINGRTNLLYALMWGFLALLWVNLLYPRISDRIEQIPNRMGRTLTWALAIFMVFDMTISGLATRRQTERHLGLPPQNVFEQHLDSFYSDELLKVIFPNMKIAASSRTAAPQ